MNAVKRALAIAWLAIVCVFLLWIVSATLGFDLVADVENLIRGIANSGQPIHIDHTDIARTLDGINTTGIPPCANEDGPGPCYWDARTMGNGTGESYNIDVLGNVTYWDGE